MILTLTMRGQAATTTSDEAQPVDVYRFDSHDLSNVTGIIVSASCDQRHLATHRERISAWIRGGGRLLTNGLPMVRYVDGMPELRRLDFHGIDDLWLTTTGEHPIWEGIDRKDLLLRTGVPGDHTFETLMQIGVAGFYAHAYLADLPKNATVITGIGPGRLPVDVSYPLGSGEVVVHAGNDLTGFTDAQRSTAGLADAVYTYLENR